MAQATWLVFLKRGVCWGIALGGVDLFKIVRSSLEQSMHRYCVFPQAPPPRVFRQTPSK